MRKNTIESVQELCGYIPYFENINPESAAQWEGGQKLNDGTFTMSYPRYEKEFLEFIDAFYSGSLLELELNYANVIQQKVPDWHGADKHKVVETADFELLKAILTACIRGEHFCDGAWIEPIKNGLFLCILQRLNVLLTNNKTI